MTAPTITRRRCADDQPHDAHNYLRGLVWHRCTGMAAQPWQLPVTSPWMTGDEAAVYLETARDTINRWARSGKLPFSLDYKGSRRFLRTDVEQFARERGL